jgi:clusterin-associated protein 1
MSEVKSARSLAAEIVESGAKVYDLLGTENETREARKKAERFLDAVSRNMDSNTESDLIERRLREQVEQVTTSVNSYNKMSKNLEEDEKNLEAKIEKKRQELERTQKRLKSLQAVRPQHMDEYEKLEVELSKLYVIYLERFRNLEYLDHELEELNKHEKEQLDEADQALKKMQQRLRDEELILLRGEQVGSEDEDGDFGFNNAGGGTGRGSGGDDADEGGMGGGIPGNKFLGRPSAAQAGAARPGTVHGKFMRMIFVASAFRVTFQSSLSDVVFVVRTAAFRFHDRGRSR